MASGPPAGGVGPAVFALLSSEAESVFDCALDGAAFTPCTNPWTLGGLAAGPHQLLARAIDSAGNVDPSPAAWAWTVGAGEPPPPGATWVAPPGIPGFELQVRILGTGGVVPTRAEPCLAETACFSAAVPGRSEVFVRVVGPKPNGFLWPTLVKLTTSQVELWVRRQGNVGGPVRYYRLPAVAPDSGDLAGLFDRFGFAADPSRASAMVTAPAMLVAAAESPRASRRAAAVDPPPPGTAWMTTSRLPGFRFQVRVTTAVGSPAPRQENACLRETLCVSAAVAGRSELFLRIVGPKPNGYLWPHVVKLTTSRVEVWIEQTRSGARRYYDLPAASPEAGVLTGLFDRQGFQP